MNSDTALRDLAGERRWIFLVILMPGSDLEPNGSLQENGPPKLSVALSHLCLYLTSKIIEGGGMSQVATTKLSSKGQVVIPEEIRKRLGLEPGAQFVVVGDGDVVILKTIETPQMSQFDDLVRQARRGARAAGLKQADITKAVSKVRKVG